MISYAWQRMSVIVPMLWKVALVELPERLIKLFNDAKRPELRSTLTQTVETI